MEQNWVVMWIECSSNLPPPNNKVIIGRDAALIAAAQAVEHYEIARYGTLVAWARQLGRSDCAAILDETLAEEKATDEKLTGLAEGGTNAAAEAVQTA